MLTNPCMHCTVVSRALYFQLTFRTYCVNRENSGPPGLADSLAVTEKCEIIHLGGHITDTQLEGTSYFRL